MPSFPRVWIITFFWFSLPTGCSLLVSSVRSSSSAQLFKCWSSQARAWLPGYPLQPVYSLCLDYIFYSDGCKCHTYAFNSVESRLVYPSCFLDNIIRMFDLYLGTKLSLSTPNMFFLQSFHLSKLSHHSPNCSFQNLGVIFYSFLSLMSCIQSNNGPVKLRLQNIPSMWPFCTTSITATFIQVPITSHLGHKIIS